MNIKKFPDSFFKLKSLCAAVIMLGFATPSYAAMTNAELQTKLEQALIEIQELKAEIKQIEAKDNVHSAAANPQVTKDEKVSVAAAQQQQTQRIDQLERQITQIATGSSNHTNEGMPIHGFIDVGAAHSSAAQPNGASIGKIDFYLTPTLSSRVKTLVELNFEVGASGDIGTDIERMQLGYVFNDHLTVWLGRFHTPYGYWNTAYHHGAQIQTSILRPKFLEFEDGGGIIPAHNVGLWATGKMNSGEGKFTYDVIIANGPRIDSGILNPNLASDDNHSAMLGANVGYEFGGTLDGLKIGVDWLKGNVDSNAYWNKQYGFLPSTQNELNMLGAYAVYLPDNWEFLNEYYHFNDKNKDFGDAENKSWAGYSQLGYHFTSWTPFVRWEKASLSQYDDYFFVQEGGGSYNRAALGIRYEIDPKSALKVEYVKTHYEVGDVRDENSTYFQYAVRF